MQRDQKWKVGEALLQALHSPRGWSAWHGALLMSVIPACIPADRSDELSALPVGSSATVYDVHTGAVDLSEPVELTGLVANTPRRDGDHSLLVQDPAGGVWSGIEVMLHHPLPGVSVSTTDELTIRAIAGSRDGRVVLVVETADGITITGRAAAVPTPVTTVADWEPLVGVVVEIAELEVLDCGGADGRLSTDADLTLDLIELDRLDSDHSPVDMGPGEPLQQLRGVIAGSAGSWHLRPRTREDLPEAAPSTCPRTIADALIEAVPSRLALDRAVVTAVSQPDDTPRAFVQDPSGGAGRGLELRSTDPIALQVGDELQLAGRLATDEGRPQLWLDGARLHPEPLALIAVPTALDPTDDLSAYQGVLVEVALGLEGALASGEVSTDTDLWLSPRLLPEDQPLPTTGEIDITGIVVVPHADATPLLMPRTESDWILR